MIIGARPYYSWGLLIGHQIAHVLLGNHPISSGNIGVIVDINSGDILVKLKTPPPTGGVYYASGWSPDKSSGGKF